MNLIDPFEFRDLFRPARSFAVVGSAPCILEWKNGPAIDAHDVVCRFNRARTDGIEESVGRRTDILFVNASNSLTKGPPPAETTKPRCLVCFVSPQGAKTLDIEPFRQWVGDCPVLLTFGPDMIGLSGGRRSRPLTTGTYALFTLLRLFEVQKLLVTGFTMMGAVAGGAGHYWEKGKLTDISFHDLDEEARLFTAILQQFTGELTVTEEIQALARQTGVTLAANGSRAGSYRGPSLGQRLAAGLAWRLLKVGMYLRRIGETN
jgi:hypothetical protein